MWFYIERCNAIAAVVVVVGHESMLATSRDACTKSRGIGEQRPKVTGTMIHRESVNVACCARKRFRRKLKHTDASTGDAGFLLPDASARADLPKDEMNSTATAAC